MKAEVGAADQSRARRSARTRRDVLAVNGWLLTEEFKVDEALPLLQRGDQGQPQRRSTAIVSWAICTTGARSRTGALAHYSAAARARIRMDFISHVFRCMELVDLGRA